MSAGRREDPDCESNANKLTEKWLDSIMNLSTKPKESMDDDGRYNKWLIRLPEGNIRLTIDKRVDFRTELITGEEMKDYCGMHLTLETESFAALDKVIASGRHPYWGIKMTLFDELDLKTIQVHNILANT